jgi:hypothetical protein
MTGLAERHIQRNVFQYDGTPPEIAHCQLQPTTENRDSEVFVQIVSRLDGSMSACAIVASWR